MLKLHEIEVVRNIAQAQLNAEYQKFSESEPPKLSTGLVRVVIEAAIEAGLIEVTR